MAMLHIGFSPFLSLRGLFCRRWQSVTIFLFFLLNSLGPIPAAQALDLSSDAVFHLPVPGVMVRLSPEYNPPILKGIKVHTDNPFKFDFILDKGDSFTKQEQLKTDAIRLIKYFLASLTVPEKDLWVNLSPYEKDRIIPPSFGQTEMGRDLLAEDYMLKQITASLIYPEDAIGKKFWKRVYEEAVKKFGTTNISVNTFNKVWIVPDKAVVYENAKVGTAYVVRSTLKVMLEQDYLALEKNQSQPGDMFKSELQGTCPQAECQPSEPLKVKASQGNTGTPTKDINALGSQIVREIVIPELTKEVNADKNFAQLRQVYNSLILANWYKKKIKDSILEQVYANKNKTAGIQYSSNNKNDVQLIYQRYLQAFKKGAYNFIKEETDPLSQEMIPRKYFSGGMGFSAAMLAKAEDFTDHASIVSDNGSQSELISAGVSPAARDAAMVKVGLEPEKIFNWGKDPYFMDAVHYFNKIIINVGSSNSIRPLTWLRAIRLYEIFRGERYSREIRTQRLAYVKGLDSIMRRANTRVMGRERVLEEAVNLYFDFVTQHYFSPDHGNVIIPGFDSVLDESEIDKDRSHPANGHHRLAWFMMNFFLLRNGYTPFYFSNQEEYDDIRDRISFHGRILTRRPLAHFDAKPMLRALIDDLQPLPSRAMVSPGPMSDVTIIKRVSAEVGEFFGIDPGDIEAYLTADTVEARYQTRAAAKSVRVHYDNPIDVGLIYKEARVLFDKYKSDQPVETVESTQKPVVLVVDDVPIQLIRMRNHLTDLGYFVLMALNGKLGLERLNQYPKIGLVITDYNMPGGRGEDFLNSIPHSKFKGKPVIVLTSDAKTTIGMLRPKFYDFVKDVLTKGLYSTLNAALERVFPVDISPAMMTHTHSGMEATRGGVDFTANRTPLEIENSGKVGIHFKVDPAMLRELEDAPGFEPVIYNIQPMRSVRSFLGLAEDPQDVP